MEYQCVMCPEDQCSKDCPTLEVLPYEGPLKEENIRKGRRLIASGMKAEEIKAKLKAAGNADAKNELINKWIEEYESKEKSPLYQLIMNRTVLIQQQELLEEQRKVIAHGQNLLESAEAGLDASRAVYEEAVLNHEGAPVPVVDDDGLPGLKKCSSNN